MKRIIEMCKPLKTLFGAFALVAGLAAATTLYAHDTQNAQGSMMRPSMMDQGGMMGMMNRMSAAVETCNKMMRGTSENSGPRGPNDQ